MTANDQINRAAEDGCQSAEQAGAAAPVEFLVSSSSEDTVKRHVNKLTEREKKLDDAIGKIDRILELAEFAYQIYIERELLKADQYHNPDDPNSFSLRHALGLSDADLDSYLIKCNISRDHFSELRALIIPSAIEKH